MKTLESRVSINYSAFQELFDAIKAMRLHCISDIEHIFPLIEFKEDLAGVEGILLTCMALESSTFELMSAVVNVLSHIAQSHLSKKNPDVYCKPALLAEAILQDIPVPFVFNFPAKPDWNPIENTYEALRDEYHRLENEWRNQDTANPLPSKLISQRYDVLLHYTNRSDYAFLEGGE